MPRRKGLFRGLPSRITTHKVDPGEVRRMKQRKPAKAPRGVDPGEIRRMKQRVRPRKATTPKPTTTRKPVASSASQAPKESYTAKDRAGWAKRRYESAKTWERGVATEKRRRSAAKPTKTKAAKPKPPSKAVFARMTARTGGHTGPNIRKAAKKSESKAQRVARFAKVAKKKRR